uniref:Uncharacterized protein n=1 Tax=Aegilops tauschii subsp. strangulata TaxID=200361 RepID=A0A453KD24_AEGTS
YRQGTRRRRLKAGEDRPCGERGAVEDGSARRRRRGECLRRRAAGVGGRGASASDQAPAGAGSRRADGRWLEGFGGRLAWIAWGPPAVARRPEAVIRELAMCQCYSTLPLFQNLDIV